MSRVQTYECLIYNKQTERTMTRICEFTSAQAESMGGILYEDGIDSTIAKKLFDHWERIGNYENVRYSYRLIE